VLCGRGPGRWHRNDRQRLQPAGHAVVRCLQSQEPYHRCGREESDGYQHEEYRAWFQAIAGPDHRRPVRQTRAQTPAVRRGQVRQQQNRN